MIFACDHKKSIIIEKFDPYKVWKVKGLVNSSTFRRRDHSTWEEYNENGLERTFQFIEFNQKDELIVQVNDPESPDYFRFTENELFVGINKKRIDTAVFRGRWSFEPVKDTKYNMESINSVEFEHK